MSHSQYLTPNDPRGSWARLVQGIAALLSGILCCGIAWWRLPGGTVHFWIITGIGIVLVVVGIAHLEKARRQSTQSR